MATKKPELSKKHFYSALGYVLIGEVVSLNIWFFMWLVQVPLETQQATVMQLVMVAAGAFSALVGRFFGERQREQYVTKIEDDLLLPAAPPPKQSTEQSAGVEAVGKKRFPVLTLRHFTTVSGVVFIANLVMACIVHLMWLVGVSADVQQTTVMQMVAVAVGALSTSLGRFSEQAPAGHVAGGN